MSRPTRGFRNSSTRSTSLRRSSERKGVLAAARPGEEEQEAVALALVAGEDVVLPEAARASPRAAGRPARAGRGTRRPPKRALDLGERREVDQDRREVALLAQHGRDLVLDLAERRDRHRDHCAPRGAAARGKGPRVCGATPARGRGGRAAARGPAEPALGLERPPQQELDLRVEAAQVVVGPALDRVEHVAVHPQQEGLALGHRGHPPTGRACRC